jgi:hypothetical protein
MLYENKFYVSQSVKSLDIMGQHSKKALKGFKRLKIKKLMQLSQSLLHYSNALKKKQQYEESKARQKKSQLVSLLRKAAGCITVQEFLTLKQFYLKLAKAYSK